MSPILRGGADHDRARTLAAARVDGPLAAPDEAWLDAHLATCDACTLAASDYEADRAMLRSLRAASPQPPRDLWARTAAAIEAEAGRGRGMARPGRPVRRVLGIPAGVLAPVAGVAVVAIVVGASLFNGAPTLPGIAPGATPIALSGGNVAVLSRGADGSLEIQTGRFHEVCPLSASGCSVEPSFDLSRVPAIAASDDVEAVISPSGDRMVVIQRGTSGSRGVFVVPVNRPSTTATAQVTTTPATPTPVPTAVPTPTVAPTESPTASPLPSPVESPSVSAPASPSESASASAETSPTASTGVIASGQPDTSPTASQPAETEPPSQPPSPTPSPARTEAPSATPVVAVTPRPDGAIQIASDVVVVAGPATYSADGTRFAFTARPADGSSGPDVYVWNTRETVARAVTDDHRSVFADWAGDDLLVSRVDAGVPSTTRIDATSGRSVGEPSRRAWLPTLSPDGTRAAWWDGGVVLDDDGVTWVPGEGRLVLGSWPDAGGEVQTIADGKVGGWQVRWDAAATALAAWVAPKAGREAGRLSLYRLDGSTGRADLAKPMLADEPAGAAFTLESGMLAWSAPGKSQGRPVQVLAWKGDQVGRGELPAEGGGTLVQ